MKINADPRRRRGQSFVACVVDRTEEARHVA